LGLAVGTRDHGVAVIAFRGLVDVVFRRFIPWPSLFGTDETRLREDDVLARRAGVFRDGSAFMYVLCSTGGNCDLTTEQNGDPNLGLVLQREILELALYTFKYDPARATRRTRCSASRRSCTSSARTSRLRSAGRSTRR
jgi:hypothetical protein